MTEVTNELHDVSELKEGQIRIREDIHSLSGRVLSVERSLFTLDERLARVEKRLDLVDA